MGGCTARLINKLQMAQNAAARYIYTSVLQRFLTLAKLADRESNTLTLSLPLPNHSNKEPTVTMGVSVQYVLDVVANCVLKKVPQKNAKNFG